MDDLNSYAEQLRAITNALLMDSPESGMPQIQQQQQMAVALTEAVNSLNQVMMQMAQAVEMVARSAEMMAQAATAPKQITTPDGRTYTAGPVLTMEGQDDGNI